MTEQPSNSGSDRQPRGKTLVAAGFLLAALAVVVLYTNRRAFSSPLALVVIAAIGVAALLLQLRLRPRGSSPAKDALDRARAARSPLWFNAIGVVFALVAVFADVLHLSATMMLMAALAAVVAFGISGVIVLNALRKRRV